MNINLTLITIGLLFWISLPLTNADIENDVYGPKLVIRTPRAISGLWKRFFGRRKQSGFQGTAQTQQPYNVAASTFYPAFVQSAFPVLPFQGPPAFGPAVATAAGGYPYPYSAHFTGFEGYTPLAQASSIYPAFSLPNTFAAAAAPTAQHGLSAPFDFHSYFEQLLRPVASGSGSNAGDQETSASTLLSTAVKPDGPSAAAAAAALQNFKNLYSFPFQLSSEGSGSSSAGEQFNLQIPFGRKHTLRRSSQDKVSNVGYQIQKLISPSQQTKSVRPSPNSVKPQPIQQSPQKQQSYISSSTSDEQIKQKAYNDQEQQLQNALFNPQEYIAQIIQQELVAQQAQLQGKSVDNSKSSASSSNDQTASSSERSSTYYPSSYYYGSGRSLPSAMTKPRATPIVPNKQQPIVTKKSTTVDQPLRTPAKYDTNSSSSSASSSSPSSLSSSSSVPVNPSSYSSANSYSPRVYKE
ncbi:uncharacterized protein LOC128397749 [Panonychus citri]|uniref:uncharacterized protein LOC128397749 n=1 Tax=Panonychus citri TaxID=50023 RepID=UPI0023081EBE|nr:uncharacterized protein LOC128397749 [Panonychus citri]